MSHIVTEAPDATEIISVAREAQHRKDQLQEVDPSKNYVSFGEGGHPAIVDLESLRTTPDRPSGTYHPATVESLIDYVEKHKQEDSTTIWVAPTSGKVIAILDDHSAAAPAWRAHRAQLDLQHTPEWDFWIQHQGLGSQEAFAELLQEGLPDILEPDGATLLEIAQTFQAKTEVVFRKGVDITSGEVKFQYDEDTQAKAGKGGDLTVPRQFKLYIAPFMGEEAVEVIANIRYRTGGGNLQIGYKLEQPERIVQASLEGVAAQLADKFDRVYRGSPA